MGAGLSSMLTSIKQNTVISGTFQDPILYAFKIVNPEQINSFRSAGFGTENKIEKFGLLKFKLEYLYQTKAYFSYQTIDRNVLPNIALVENCKPFRPNYMMLGITYCPAFFK